MRLPNQPTKKPSKASRVLAGALTDLSKNMAGVSPWNRLNRPLSKREIRRYLANFLRISQERGLTNDQIAKRLNHFATAISQRPKSSPHFGELFLFAQSLAMDLSFKLDAPEST